MVSCMKEGDRPTTMPSSTSTGVVPDVDIALPTPNQEPTDTGITSFTHLSTNKNSTLRIDSPTIKTITRDTEMHTISAVKPEPYRLAEKNRKSTCAFADTIAENVIAKWRQVTHTTESDPLPSQTVLAGFVLRHEKEGTDPIFEVVALGLGTKFLPQEVIRKDPLGTRVRDCHAEVLARRALVAYLYRQVECFYSCVNTANCILEKSAEGRLRVRPSTTIHLYTSSQPCGNASMKRWAKTKHQYFDASLGRNDPPPNEAHTRMDFSNRAIGQIAMLVKKDASVDAEMIAAAVEKEFGSKKSQNLAKRGRKLKSINNIKGEVFSQKAECADEGLCGVGGRADIVDRETRTKRLINGEFVPTISTAHVDTPSTPPPTSSKFTYTDININSTSNTNIAADTGTIPITRANSDIESLTPSSTQSASSINTDMSEYINSKTKTKPVKNSNGRVAEEANEHISTSAAFATKTETVKAMVSIACDKDGTIPPGTAPSGYGLGYLKTCSDKIAKWNVLGLQGGLLSHYLHPVFMSSLTVGRKFSEVHCRRAMCCRLESGGRGGRGRGRGRGNVRFSRQTQKNADAHGMRENPKEDENRVITYSPLETTEASTPISPTTRTHKPTPTHLHSKPQTTQIDARVHTPENAEYTQINHPRFMGTAVKLDKGIMTMEDGAVFGNQAFIWSACIGVCVCRICEISQLFETINTATKFTANTNRVCGGEYIATNSGYVEIGACYHSANQMQESVCHSSDNNAGENGQTREAGYMNLNERMDESFTGEASESICNREIAEDVVISEYSTQRCFKRFLLLESLSSRSHPYLHTRSHVQTNMPTNSIEHVSRDQLREWKRLCGGGGYEATKNWLYSDRTCFEGWRLDE
eukprot:CFRG5030T1